MQAMPYQIPVKLYQWDQRGSFRAGPIEMSLCLAETVSDFPNCDWRSFEYLFQSARCSLSEAGFYRLLEVVCTLRVIDAAYKYGKVRQGAYVETFL